MKKALYIVIFLQLLFTVGHFITLDIFSNYFSVLPVTIISYDDYILAFLAFLALLSVAFFLAWLTWLVFRKRAFSFIMSLFVFNLIILAFWSTLSFPALKANYIEKMHRNVNQNQRMIFKNGGYLDTCMIMVHNDIASSNSVSPNSFVLLWSKHDEKLSEIPKDTIDGKFPLRVIYGIKKGGVKSVRESQYLFDLNYRFVKVTDIALDDKVADEGLKNFEEFQKGKRVLNIGEEETPF